MFCTNLLFLAYWAEKGGTLGLHYADDARCAALQAGLAGALINAVFILIIARLVVGGAIGAVAERGSLMPYGFFQDFLHGGADCRPVAGFQFVAGPGRVDACAGAIIPRHINFLRRIGHVDRAGPL